MAKKYSITILILIACSLFSCSWITDFAVFNKSDNPIKLKYKFKLHSKKSGEIRCSEIDIFGGPEKPKDGDYKGSKTFWEEIPIDEYTLSEDHCEVEISLEPNDIIKICSIPTYTGHKSGRHEYFSVAQLSIITNKGVVMYSGFELVRQFKKKSDQLYVLEYK